MIPCVIVTVKTQNSQVCKSPVVYASYDDSICLEFRKEFEVQGKQVNLTVGI